MPYLLDRDADPITAAEIRAALHLRTTALDKLIEAGIAHVCASYPMPLQREVWAETDATLASQVKRGAHVLHVGPLVTVSYHPEPLRRVTYGPTERDISIARQQIIRWCMNQPDILDQRASELPARARMAEVA